MPTEYFVALDVHQSFTEMVAMTGNGKIVDRSRCETTIPTLRSALDQVRRPRYLTFEEGPLAGWLTRNLQPHVDRLVVSEPRRNHLIAKDSDKDDPIDAEKLGHLFRGGYLKEVHQPATLDRALLKQFVGFYHDSVRDRVRLGHQLAAIFRRHGAFPRVSELADQEGRKRWQRKLPRSKLLDAMVERAWQSYTLACEHEDENRRQLIRAARREPMVRRFTDVPGISWIRGVTFYVYVDTPERFAKKSALWRYCGIGLERRHSGAGPGQTRLCHRGNRSLKNVCVAAAKTAIESAENPFQVKYQHWLEEPRMGAREARRNVARALAATLWSLWKHDCQYEPEKVGGVA